MCRGGGAAQAERIAWRHISDLTEQLELKTLPEAFLADAEMLDAQTGETMRWASSWSAERAWGHKGWNSKPGRRRGGRYRFRPGGDARAGCRADPFRISRITNFRRKHSGVDPDPFRRPLRGVASALKGRRVLPLRLSIASAASFWEAVPIVECEPAADTESLRLCVGRRTTVMWCLYTSSMRCAGVSLATGVGGVRVGQSDGLSVLAVGLFGIRGLARLFGIIGSLLK